MDFHNTEKMLKNSEVEFYDEKNKEGKKVNISNVEEMIDKKPEAINDNKELFQQMIPYLEKANKEGVFELEESKNLFISFQIINNYYEGKSSNEEYDKVVKLLIKASCIANKKGSYTIKESYDLAMICDKLMKSN